MEYQELTFKIPEESSDYAECSEFVIAQIDAILRNALAAGKTRSSSTQASNSAFLWRISTRSRDLL